MNRRIQPAPLAVVHATPTAVLFLLLSCVLFAMPVNAQDGASGRPNVLFIAIDDMKPELGCYGSSEVLSPSIDKLASQSTVFLNAHCQFPVCGSSRASLMTGLRPESNGVMDLKTNVREKNPDVITLPQMFRNQGYTTAGVGKIFDPRCVDSKKDCDKPSWSIPFTPFEYSKISNKPTKEYALATDIQEERLVDGWIRSKAVGLIQKLAADENPFFLAIGFKKPHLPFVAPKKYWDLYDPSKIRLAEYQQHIENDSGYAMQDSEELRKYDGVPESGPMPEPVQRRSIHGYRACVSYIDAQVGMVLNELEKQGLSDNTIVVLWGDHGFHLGDHGMWGKHSTLEQATRVPLMIRMPGKDSARTSQPVELCDLLPTLGKAAGLDVHKTDGRSLNELLGSPDAKSPREGALTVFKRRGAFGYSFRTSRYRLTKWINKKNKIVGTELYDYEVDPLEKVNLSGDPRYVQTEAQLSEQILKHAQGCDRLLTSSPKSDQSIGRMAPLVSIGQQVAVRKRNVQPESTIRSHSNPNSDFPLLIGAASNAKYWDTDSFEILNREFAYVTPGNDFKQTAIHPQPGKWKWKKADRWIELCEKNDQVMRLHSAISPQCSKWAKSDERTGEELKENLIEYMTAICKRYNDKPHVRWMDVVNETVSRNGEWFGPREGNERWENPWPQIGIDESHPLKPPVYIKLAFETANQHAPNIQKILNQHGGMEAAMWDRVMATVEYLQEKHIRIDGVGWQAHIDTGFENDPENIRKLRSLIEWAQSRDLEFHVTEFNAWIRKEEKNAPISASDLAAQANTYRAIVEILHEYSSRSVVTWCAWQICDDETERGHLHGNLFNADAEPKPAFEAIRDFVKRETAAE